MLDRAQKNTIVTSRSMSWRIGAERAAEDPKLQFGWVYRSNSSPVVQAILLRQSKFEEVPKLEKMIKKEPDKKKRRLELSGPFNPLLVLSIPPSLPSPSGPGGRPRLHFLMEIASNGRTMGISSGRTICPMTPLEGSESMRTDGAAKRSEAARRSAVGAGRTDRSPARGLGKQDNGEKRIAGWGGQMVKNLLNSAKQNWANQSSLSFSA